MPFNSAAAGNNVVPFYAGGQVSNPVNLLVRQTAPPAAVAGKPGGEPVGTIWLNVLTGNVYMLVQNTFAVGQNWDQLESSGGTGDQTVTGGNLVIATAGQGVVFPVTAVGPGASPQISNARAGSVTFSGVSIAAGATQTFTITNSTITGATTRVLYAHTGATAGAALTMVSQTNSAGSSAVVITNGTGATTTTANITFDYIVLN